MSAINGFNSQISGLSLALESVGSSQTKGSEPLVISIDPRDLGVASGSKMPPTIQVTSKQTELQLFKKFGFDVKDEDELAALKQRLGGRDPFAYVLSDPSGYTAKLENGKYVVRTRIDTDLRKELQGIAARAKAETQNNVGANTNPNIAGAERNGIDEGAWRRAELERKFPNIPNVVTLPPNPNTGIHKQAAAGLKVLQQLGEHLAKNPPTAEEAVDALQTALDLIGIVDPTPLSDGTNAVISTFRGHYGYAAISVIAAVIPYLGDFAKLGKLPKIIEATDKSLDLIKNAPKITKEMEAALEVLSKNLDDVPTGGLPKAAQETLGKLTTKVDDAIEGVEAAKTMDVLPDFMAKTGDGKRVLVGRRAKAEEVMQVTQELEASGVKIVKNADTRIDKVNKKAAAAFDYNTGELLLRKDATFLEVFHEKTHAKQWSELGKENYKAMGKLAREEHVYKTITENKHLFSQRELDEAKRVIDWYRIQKSVGSID